MELIQLIIMAMFDMAGYIIISKKIINQKNLNKWIYLIYILAFSILIGLARKYLPKNYNIMISWVLIIFMFFLIYRKDMKETIYLFVISTTIMLLIQFSIVIILQFLGKNLEFSFTNGFMAQMIGLIVDILVSIYLPINIIFNYVVENNRVFKYLISNMLFILTSILLYWNMNIEGILKNIISIAVISIGIIYINFVLLKNGLKNEYETKQLQIYEDYLPVIDELISELRKKQHEFDNHIQALNMLTITSTDYESIICSMKNYINDLEIESDLSDLIKLDNKILAGFLYSKVKRAIDLDIDFKIIIKDYGFKVELKDYELVEIMGNLINNAFETKVDGNIVILTLRKEKDMDVIELKNKHPYLNIESINKIFKEGFSTKSNNGRGYGLYNIKEIVEKYNGEIQVFNKRFDGDNYVVFKLLFF